jgi:RecA-family ATPase
MIEIDHSRQTYSLLVPADEFIQGVGTSWLIEGILPAASLGLLYAQPAAFKTFIALGMARGVLTGEPFCGHNVMSSGSVIYICLEGKGGATQRVRGVCEGLTPDQRHRLQVVKQPLRLPDTSKDDWEKLVKELAAYVASRGPIRLIIVDTFAQLSEAEENSSTGVGKVLGALQQLIDKFGGTVLVIHHEGKAAAKGMRGSNALAGAADTIMRAERLKGSMFVKLHCEKQKDADEFDAFDIELEEVNLANGKQTLIVKGAADPKDAAHRRCGPATSDSTPRVSAAKTQILKVLADSPEAMARGNLESQVMKAADVSEGTFTTALNELKEAGEIFSHRRGFWEQTPR